MDAIAAGVKRDRWLSARRLAGAAVAGAVLAVAAPLGGVGQSASSKGPLQSVIVRAVPGAEAAAEKAVVRVGGTVQQQLGVINGFTAKVPANRVPWLSMTGAVAEATPDASGHFLSDAGAPPAGAVYSGSPLGVSTEIDAKETYKHGITGAGVDVAL